MSNWGFVSLAFGLSWIVLLTYTVSLLRRQARASAALSAALESERAAARSTEQVLATHAEVA